jgi:hypothetical protein
MKEKKFFSVMAALLLGASLFFIGCDDGGGTVPNWYDGLGNVGVDADTVTVSGTRDLTAPLTVPNGKKLVIGEDAVLTVKPGVALTVAGTVEVEGGLDVPGTLNISGAVTVKANGSYTFQASGTGTNSGTITIESEGEVLALDGSDMAGPGFTVVEAGGKAYAGATAESKWLLVGSGSDNNAAIQLASNARVFTNNASYELDGEATLHLFGQNSAEFRVGETGTGSSSSDKNRTLTLRAGSKLTVPGTDSNIKRTLRVYVDEGKPGVVGNTNAQIVIQQYGQIDVYEKAGTAPSSSMSTIGHNFYTSGSGKESANGLKQKTYAWDGTLNGTAGGWKAGS